MAVLRLHPVGPVSTRVSEFAWFHLTSLSVNTTSKFNWSIPEQMPHSSACVVECLVPIEVLGAVHRIWHRSGMRHPRAEPRMNIHCESVTASSRLRAFFPRRRLAPCVRQPRLEEAHKILQDLSTVWAIHGSPSHGGSCSWWVLLPCCSPRSLKRSVLQKCRISCTSRPMRTPETSLLKWRFRCLPPWNSASRLPRLPISWSALDEWADAMQDSGTWLSSLSQIIL